MVNDLVNRYLHEAAKKEDYELATRFLGLHPTNGMDVNARDGYGMTALMWAAGRGSQEIVLLLLQHGADMEARNELLSVRSIEKLATGKSDYWELIDRMGTLEANKHHGWTALMWAARNGQTEVANFLLDSGANINAITQDSFTALVHAIDNKHVETALLLLERGANPDLVEDGCSPALPTAAGNGFLDLVQAILDHGGKISALDNYGHTALINAVLRNKPKVLRLLLNHGFDPNIVQTGFLPPLHLTLEDDALRCAGILLDHGADINAKDEVDGETALQSALDEMRSPRVARLLIERGADIWGALGRVEYFRGSAEGDEMAEADEIIELIKKRAADDAGS